MLKNLRSWTVLTMIGCLLMGIPATAGADGTGPCNFWEGGGGAGVGDPTLIRVYWGNKGPTLRYGMYAGAESGAGYIRADGRADFFTGIVELDAETATSDRGETANAKFGLFPARICVAQGSETVVDKRG